MFDSQRTTTFRVVTFVSVEMETMEIDMFGSLVEYVSERFTIVFVTRMEQYMQRGPKGIDECRHFCRLSTSIDGRFA